MAEPWEKILAEMQADPMVQKDPYFQDPSMGLSRLTREAQQEAINQGLGSWGDPVNIPQSTLNASHAEIQNAIISGVLPAGYDPTQPYMIPGLNTFEFIPTNQPYSSTANGSPSTMPSAETAMQPSPVMTAGDEMSEAELDWLTQAIDTGFFKGDLGQVPFDQTVPTANWDPDAVYTQQMVDDPRLQMRIDLAEDLLRQGTPISEIEQFLGKSLDAGTGVVTSAGPDEFQGVGTRQWFEHLAAQPEVMAEIDPLTGGPIKDVVNTALAAIEAGKSPTLPWVDSPEFTAAYGAPATPADDGTIDCPVGQHAENGVCVPDQVVQQTDFGGPGEKPAAMTPVGNFVNSQNEALAVIQRRLDEITKATNDARDAGIEQIDIIQSEAQKQLDATFANQYTVLDPMTGEPLKEGEMDRLLNTWSEKQSKSKTAREADKQTIKDIASFEGIIESDMEFDTLDTLYGDQMDAQFQYIDSLYRIGKLAKDDRDAMLGNIMAGYKSDLVSKAIEIILGAEIDTADRRAEVREDALSARDVAEYLGVPANTLFAGMRGDIPIGEMAFQTSERIAGQDFIRDEAELDRLAQGINPATGRPYGFMTSGPYAGMTIGEANAARQDKDLIDLQMELMQAEEQRAVDAVDLEAERYEDMWREGAFYDQRGNLIEGVGTGWYDIGINPATGDPWTTDDDDVYGEPIPSGFYAADFEDMVLPNVEVIDGQYWMTPSQFAQIGPMLEANLAQQQSGVFGDVGDPAGIIQNAAMRVGGDKYSVWQEKVRNRLAMAKEAEPTDATWLHPETTEGQVWEMVISESAYTDPSAGAVWANYTGQPVMGTTPQGVAFTANPDGTVRYGEPVDNNFMPGQSVRGPDQGPNQG